MRQVDDNSVKANRFTRVYKSNRVYRVYKQGSNQSITFIFMDVTCMDTHAYT